MRPDDLHRPAIDNLTRPNPDDPTGTSIMRRVPEVLDCWFESGSMPFAQVHYPFENREWFDSHYPGDFIVEYIGQTRGWFYTAARPGDRAVRPPGLPDLRQPRHRARQRRPEDVQVAAQLPGRQRGLRHLRLGRDALVPHGQPDPARRQPGRHRAGHPRGRPAGAAAAVELVLLLRAVRERGGLHGRRRAWTASTCSTATSSPRRRRRSRRPGRASWTSTTSPAPARRCATTWSC